MGRFLVFIFTCIFLARKHDGIRGGRVGGGVTDHEERYTLPLNPSLSTYHSLCFFCFLLFFFFFFSFCPVTATPELTWGSKILPDNVRNLAQQSYIVFLNPSAKPFPFHSRLRSAPTPSTNHIIPQSLGFGNSARGGGIDIWLKYAGTIPPAEPGVAFKGN